jgi:hypothetical protein
MNPDPSSPDPAPTDTKGKPTWLWLILWAGTMTVLFGALFAAIRPEKEPDYSFSDLPECFDRAHRIRPAQQVIPVEGIGLLQPPPVVPSAEFSPQWLQQSFTHYVADDAFVWATAKYQYPSDGKILAGTKIVLGKHVNELSLVCTVTKDGRAINLFMQTRFLRERSQGPPEIRDDD